jgi:hypothetical protein
MSKAAELYNQDFFLWTQEQASALREAAQAGANLPLDWENLAEEVESLGASQRRELRNQIANVVEHLLKLEYSPALDPRRDWTETVRREWVNIDRLLEDSPSLRGELTQLVTTETARIAKLVAEILGGRGEISRATEKQLMNTNFTESQVLGDWLPPPRRC